jgi:hypothetical protein
MTVMSMSASAATPASQKVDVRAGLSWGVKASFTRYVDSMPDGRRGAGYGATETDGGIFFFELDDASEYDVDTGRGVVKYRGDVRYKAHGGMLFVMVVDPWLEFQGDSASLTVIDAERWPERNQRITLATLLPDEQGSECLPSGWASLEARLSPQGVHVFNDVYSVGELLEPVRYCAAV